MEMLAAVKKSFSGLVSGSSSEQGNRGTKRKLDRPSNSQSDNSVEVKRFKSTQAESHETFPQLVVKQVTRMAGWFRKKTSYTQGDRETGEVRDERGLNRVTEPSVSSNSSAMAVPGMHTFSRKTYNLSLRNSTIPNNVEVRSGRESYMGTTDMGPPPHQVLAQNDRALGRPAVTNGHVASSSSTPAVMSRADAVVQKLTFDGLSTVKKPATESRVSATGGAEGPAGRADTTLQQSFARYGGRPRHTFYEKVLTSGPPFNLSTSRSRTSSRSSAVYPDRFTVKQSVRVGERERYQELLRQFSGDNLVRQPARLPPAAGTVAAFGDANGHAPLTNGYTESVSSSTASDTVVAEAKLPLRSTTNGPSEPFIKPSIPASRERGVGLSKGKGKVLPTEGKGSAPKPIVIPDDDDDVQITDWQPPKKPQSPLDELRATLAASPVVSARWLDDLNSRFGRKARERERQIKEESLKVKILEEQRGEDEEEIEAQLRHRLHLSRRQKPVIPDPEEESESESEEEEEDDDEFPELSDEAEAAVSSALVPNPGEEVLSEGFRISITRQDVASLAGLNWLNDEIINFYLNLVVDRSKQDNCTLPMTYAFNTFFYPKYQSAGYKGVQRWTRKVDVFSHDVLLVPIHLGMHWCMATIDLEHKVIRYFDSMGNSNDRCLMLLRQYIGEEHQDKKKAPLDLQAFKLVNMTGIPQQMNGSDCGVFACKYAEYSSRRADFTFSQSNMPYFRRRMVYEILTKTLM